MLLSTYLQQYKSAILSLPKGTVLTKQDLQVEKLLMERNGKVEMYYAPIMSTLILLLR